MFELAGEWLQQVADWANDHRFALINAGLLLVFGWFFARWAGKRLHRMRSRFGRASPYRPFIASVVRHTIFALVLVLALAAIGVPIIGPVVLFVAIALATALALQGTLHDATGGAVVHALCAIKTGDEIEMDGVAGTVTNIGLLTTSLRSDDGVFISVPNSQLSTAVVRNYSRLGTRRFEVALAIGYDQDIDEVLVLCRDLLEANGRVLRDPPPDAVVTALGETSVAIAARGWTSSSTYADVVCQLNRDFKKALDAANVHWAPTAPRLPTQVVEPPTYIAAAFRSRGRSRAIEP